MEKGEAEVLLVVCWAWPAMRHLPSHPSPSTPPGWGQLRAQARGGHSEEGNLSLPVPNTCTSLPTFCQVPLLGWMASEAQCLSAAVPITSRPSCVLPHCLAMASSHKNQHQGIVPPGGLDAGEDPGQQ